MDKSKVQPRFALGIITAIAGGAIGYWVFFWIASQGFYALLLPAGLLGIAAGYGIRDRSVPFAIVCGVAGLGLALFTEWRFAPFKADRSLMFFLTHVPSLKPMTLLMLAVSPVISYRLALGMDAKASTAEGNLPN